jgi:hypothetical protein
MDSSNQPEDSDEEEQEEDARTLKLGKGVLVRFEITSAREILPQDSLQASNLHEC